MHFGKTSIHAALFLMLTCVGSIQAKDHFLVIGGGYSPSGNQISLEKNVLMFQQILKEQYPDNSKSDIFFSDGNDAGRDLQFEEPAEELPRLNHLLGLVFQKSNDLGYQYRSHKIQNIQGASNRKNLDKWFDQDAKRVQPGDRVFIYITAHGGRAANKKEPYNTKLMLWNHESINTREFVGMLDKLPPEASVVVVAVQCFSGGFADLIFTKANRKTGVTPARRCGFFATVHDRPAAGCTADINEADYKEYSTYFWTALRGKNRTGQAITLPDYDKNGAVSFDEAHAYALLESNSIDISITTSDAFLRSVSRTSDKKIKGLLSLESPLAKLLPLASPAQRAVINGLSAEFKLSGSDRGKDTKKLAVKLLADKKKFDKEHSGKSSAYKKLAKEIRTALITQWPELSNTFNPRAIDLLSNRGPELQAAIEKNPKFKQLLASHAELETAAAAKLDADRRWAKSQRLVRTLENLALVGNLPKVATPENQARYQQLRADESGLFGSQHEVSASVNKSAAEDQAPAG
jgi:hypothetical protein